MTPSRHFSAQLMKPEIIVDSNLVGAISNTKMIGIPAALPAWRLFPELAREMESFSHVAIGRGPLTLDTRTRRTDGAPGA
jgi:hypothetical protein